jgi:hypothetical protein
MYVGKYIMVRRREIAARRVAWVLAAWGASGVALLVPASHIDEPVS